MNRTPTPPLHAVLALCSVAALAPGLGRAQDIGLTGTCPGAATISVSGATPGGTVYVVSGNGQGTTVIPTGPCAGQDVDLAGGVTVRAQLVADGGGNVAISPNLPVQVCDAWVQALDLSTCGTTPAVQISAELDGGGISCTPTSNPLRYTCDVHVSPPAQVEVAWRRTDGLGSERTEISAGSDTQHEVPVMFLAPETEYLVGVYPVGDPANPIGVTTFTTGSVPNNVESYLTVTGSSSVGLIGGEAPCTSFAIAVIYDTETGDLVWYQDLDPNGALGWLDMVRFTDEHTILGETEGQVVEVDLHGQDITRFDVSYPGCCGLHHDINTYGDNYIGFFQDTVGGLTVDELVVLDPTGDELFNWSPRDHLDIPPGAQGDWLHTNSVSVDADGNILLSWLQRDTVAKIKLTPGPGFGDVMWFLDGNPPDDLNGPETLPIDWSGVGGNNNFRRQHNFSRLDDGRYLMVDSQNGRGLVLSVDAQQGTARAEAEYETFESSCGPQGTAAQTDAGNFLVGCSTEHVLERNGATGAEEWHGTIQCPNGGGGGFSPRAQTRWYSLDGW